jgi:RNA polymerase sigma-70 factor (ECF subfamily)
VRKDDDKMELALSPPRDLVEARRSDRAAAPEETDDSELLRRIAGGDTYAFDALYRRYVRSVYGLALRRLRDRVDAEDAVQQAFTAVWRSAKTYRPERGPVSPWLYTIARNAIVDRRRGPRAETGTELPDTPSSEAGPPERAESSFVSWRVHRALEELPPSEREVIELAYWSGLSQSEVADYLGIPLGTVKTRTRSGLGRLATLLGEELG